MKKLLTFLFAIAMSSAAMSAEVPADCAVTHRHDNAWQGKLTARVGVHWSNTDYQWVMGQGFTIPAGRYTSAKLVVPSLAVNDYADPAVTGPATVYVTLAPTTPSAIECSGYNGAAMLLKPSKDRADLFTAATFSTPWVNDGMTIALNAKALAAINAAAGKPGGFVVGVSNAAPTKTVVKDGETKKAKAPAMVVNFERETPCDGTPSPWCPVLVLN